MKRIVVTAASSLLVYFCTAVYGQATRPSPSANRYSVSALSIDQARQELRELEKQLNEQTNSLPPLPAKDIFETTLEYERRRADYEKRTAPALAAVKAKIDQVRTSVYRSPNEKPSFKNYEADTQRLTATLLNKTFDAIIETSLAKQMYQDWPGVQAAVSYFEVGSEPSLVVLLWKEFQFGGRLEGTSSEGVYAIGGGVTEPRPISMAQPEYSDEGRKARLQGSVELVIVVNPDGTVKFESVKRGLGYGLDQKAIEAVKRWKFAPGMKDGKPVATRITVMMNFSLR